MSKTLHSNQKDKISTEMYLKTIFLLQEQGIKPKPVDLVKELKLSKGSISEMIKKLTDDKLINYESFGNITFTKKGLQKAKNVVRKYLTVKDFLINVLKVPLDKVHDEACNLEHAFSDESIVKLNVLNKLKKSTSR
jgi:DtxR family transcriptional regulator, Mn-dependent transcriptional regulator